MIRAYIAHRQTENAANATINRELALLKRAFRLAINDGLLLARPHVPMLQEDNVRRGFFSREEFENVRGRLPESVRGVVTFAYITGWRVRSEILKLQWHQVDFEAGTVRLDVGTTKNRGARTFYFGEHAELLELMTAQRA